MHCLIKVAGGRERLEGVLHQVDVVQIVGVAGVSGNGQRELVEALAGQHRAVAGRILVHGEPYRATRPEMIRHRIACLPEESLCTACVADMSVAENMALCSFDQPPASPTASNSGARRCVTGRVA